MASFPAPPWPDHWGTNFTPTVHKSIYPDIDPSSVTLKRPYVVLITGAGKGIGEHIALGYAKAGASGIVIASRTASDLQTLSGKISAIDSSIKVLAIPTDVVVESEVEALAAKTEQTFGRLDACVNNAGTTSALVENPDGTKRYPIGLLEDTTEDFKRCFDLNFYGTYYLARYLMPLLIKTKDGPQSLVNIVSIALQQNFSTLTALPYNVSKGAVQKLTEHIDSAHRKDGIVTFALHPANARTSLTKELTGIWENILIDDVDLCGGFCVWLTKEKREWLSGRYLMSNYDVKELESMREEIVKGEKLKFTMDV